MDDTPVSETETINTPEETGTIRNEKGQFVPGVSGNPFGRPPGSVSPITRLRQIFSENPDEFEAFVKRYKDNPQNEKHVVEMLDHKPLQQTDITSGGEKVGTLLVKFLDGKDNGDTGGV